MLDAMSIEEHGRIFSVRPARLAAPLLPGYNIPTLAELGIKFLEEELLEWQLVGTQAWFFEVAAIQVTEKDRWSELALLFGSTAEGMLLAATAEVEIALLRGLADHEVARGVWLAMRF